ncbi:hypothetical protein D3C84_1039340 [compost metagenome]
MLGQRHGSGCRQGDTLVGRAEQHIERNLAVDDRRCIETPELSQGRTTVEQAGIEEIRAGAPGLEGEFTEAQNPAVDGKTNEVALIRLHEESRIPRI